MKIFILNKREFNKHMTYRCIDDSNVESQDAMFISINNPHDKDDYMSSVNVKSHFHKQHSNVLIMHFWDFGELASEDLLESGSYSVFNKYRAKKLLEFIYNNRNKKFAFIHCQGGISRSGAIGQFIFDNLSKIEDYREFKKRNYRIQPNQYIVKVLNNELKRFNKNFI